MGLFGKSKDDGQGQRAGSKIVIASGCRGSGISFTAELLAMGLSKHGSVSLTEMGLPHFYDALGFEKHFLVRGYTDFTGKIKAGERVDYKQSASNSFESVNWICRLPGDREALTAAQLFRLFYLPTEKFAIFDCSGLDYDNSFALLAEADYPVCVIDPLPSRLAESRDFLEKIRISLPECLLIVNKMNPGVHCAELNRFLGTKDYFSIPSVNPEYIYKGEYNSVSFCKIDKLCEILGRVQDILLGHFI